MTGRTAMTVGRRGFVGAMAGALAVVTGASGTPVPGPGLPGETGRTTGLAEGPVAYDRVAVRVGGRRATVLLPAAPRAVAWLPGGATGAAALATAAVGARLAVVAIDAPSDGAASDQALLRLFAWGAEALEARDAIVLGAGAACDRAAAVVGDRLLPRVQGLYLDRPDGTLALGPAAYWTGRRLRLLDADPRAAAEAARIALRAAEASTGSGPVAVDAPATIGRWLAA